jgi:hypothetical protein
MRTVRVDLSCWQGYSAGASHYYVRITEGGWGERDGRTFRSKFSTYDDAKSYIDEILSAHFPPAQYEYESTGETEIVFVYDRVGD